MANKIKIKVEGELIEVDLDEELTINDMGEDQQFVAARMAFWGSLAAAAEGEKIRTDAYYRTWRAKLGSTILKKDPKTAEWKVRQQIEADENFEKLKASIAAAQQNVSICKNTFESFKTKASQLQSKGAMMRAELDATGMSTKRKEPRTPRARARAEEVEIERDEKKNHMKKMFDKKKKA